jgi:NAD(P)H-flavin reductase
MLYAFGIGEVPISISGHGGDDGDPSVLVQTLRAVGAVTRALCDARPAPRSACADADPYGTDWDVPSAAGRDLVIVAGGIGLALSGRRWWPRCRPATTIGGWCWLVGARTPRDLLFPGELETWRRHGIDVEITVDQPDGGWTGHVGLVTTLVDRADFDPAGCVAFVCRPRGDDALHRAFAAAPRSTRRPDPGLPGTGHEVRDRLCGHCQLGPVLICRDGPVFAYGDIAPLLVVKEL